MTVSEIQQAIAKLEAGIANSAVVKSMTFGDQSFTFRDVDEMRAVLGDLRNQLAQAQGKSSSRLASFSKGA